MHKILYYECFSGLSGDMNLGALIDIGVPETHLRTQLSLLNLDHEFELVVERAQKQGITGTKATVRLTHEHHHHHDHHHNHDHHYHRTYANIRTLIDNTPYAQSVKDIARAIFHTLAVAEAKIHNTSVDAVHFHEVGATDAIVDIIGAAIGLDYLMQNMNVTQVLASTIELGSGFVRCAHGVFPVPAPATMEILQDVPVHRGRVDSEATTPTGAAILKATVHQFTDTPNLRVDKIGYGLGQKEFSIPNLVRVTLATVASYESSGRSSVASLAKGDWVTADCYEIEANVDDMSAEAYAPLMDVLFDMGADDVYFTPIIMKKSRPATKISILCVPERVDALVETLLTHSTTIGVRVYPFQKHMLPRELVTVTTNYGDVRVKKVRLPNGHIRWKSEHEDVRQLAQKHEVSYLTMKQNIDQEIERNI
ncbi:MAG: nickel pincer cofactor biosynthesis protein LarC [Chloroflexota bacterium]